MKHQTLKVIASCLKILTGVAVVVGILGSIRLGIIATTLPSAIIFLLGGFFLTALGASILMGTSKIIYLFIDIEEELREIARLVKNEPKD